VRQKPCGITPFGVRFSLISCTPPACENRNPKL
jgi:hypothetical protein